MTDEQLAEIEYRIGKWGTENQAQVDRRNLFAYVSELRRDLALRDEMIGNRSKDLAKLAEENESLSQRLAAYQNTGPIG